MKAFIFFLLFSCSVSLFSTTRIHLTISDDINTEAQYIYLFSAIENQKTLVDSCFLDKGQKSVMFTIEKIANECTAFWLTFSKKGPIQTMLYLSDGEDVRLDVTNKTGRFTETYGSQATMEEYQNQEDGYWALRRIKVLSDSLKNIPKENHLYDQLKDSISYYEYFRDIGRYLKQIKTTKVAGNYLLSLSILGDFLTEKEIDSLAIVMKVRFPYNKRVQQYPNFTPSAPATEKSKRALKRFQEIADKRFGIKRQEVDKHELKNRLDSIQSFTLGSKIENLSLPGLSGKDISIDNIQSEYILIDFWASWCTPCRKEFPNVKATYEKYKDKLTIYAISLDNTEKEWKETIEKDKLEMFTHVYGGSPLTFETQKLSKMFGVNAIPANFLLDKDRKIIAVNLRGDALIKKTEEIIDSK